MIKVAVIGLDTSHSVELPRLMQAPDVLPESGVPGMRAVTCMRFETPFQKKDGLDKRQKQLEGWGVKVTESFDEAIADCDAIMLEINDGSYHLEYFRKVAALGKPVFLDKPLAGSLEDGREIMRLARQHGTRVWSASSLPFAPAVLEAVKPFTKVQFGHSFGALGTAPAGDSLIWYGVHAVEMLQRIMGAGAKSVRAIDSSPAILISVDYGEGRHGLVEAIRGSWVYGGRVQGAVGDQARVTPFVCDSRNLYRDLLVEVKQFFLGGPAPIEMAKTFEGLAIMTAARQSIETGRSVDVPAL
jgi:hypothetical protein